LVLVVTNTTFKIRRHIDLVHSINNVVDFPAFIAHGQTKINLAFIAFAIFPENKIALLEKNRINTAWTVHMLESSIAF